LEAIRLSAAVLVAQVWAGERFAPDHGLEASALRDCIHTLDDVPVHSLLSYVSTVLNPPQNSPFSMGPNDRQALVLGIAHAYLVQRRATQPDEITDWLLALPNKTIWTDELAPAVVYGTIDAPRVEVGQLVARLTGSLTRCLAADAAEGGGSIRARAYEFCRSVLDRFGQHLNAPAAERSRLEAVQGYWNQRAA
jgi:hypothetical protein